MNMSVLNLCSKSILALKLSPKSVKGYEDTDTEEES